jgi:hypothetical protein
MRFIEILFMGFVATATLDLWQIAVKAFGGPPPVNWGLIGRWVYGFRRGEFVHASIAAAPPRRHEGAAGWCFHYAVGAAYAGLYVAVLLDGFGLRSSLLGAVAFSLALVPAPWFVMQPALGLGVMAARASAPWSSRFATLSSHLAFGIGLYAGGLVGLDYG